MSLREMTALGTSSQVPTRTRNHNGYLLRWDGEGILFDPGEGTQRQMTFGDLSASSIDRICITHFHGDHCLGLAGILQRLSLDRVKHPIHIHYPESGDVYYQRLQGASIYVRHSAPRPVPIPEKKGLQLIAESERYRLFAAPLDHRVPTMGYRLEERAGPRFLPERLQALGVKGPRIGELARKGTIVVKGKTIRLEDVSVPRPVSSFAFVMDTRPCPGALELARSVDLLVMEATYADGEEKLAREYRHSTAREAAETARQAGVRQLAITHFSERYTDVDEHLAQARSVFPNTIALRDLDRIEIPRRRS